MKVSRIDDTPRNVQCANCGGNGHVYKNCNHPVTSYGVICFQLMYDHQMNVYPRYLMVQRKDSLSFVEFIRGKYTIDQKAYLMRLISNMTPKERDGLRNKTFEELWRALWVTEDTRAFIREFHEAKMRFEMLKRGCIMKNDNNEIFYFDINFILDNTTCLLAEPEWGFPKGRRNINEHDLVTALRECKEESGVEPHQIHVVNNLKPFEEVFSGTNKVRYRHVYYLGYCLNGKKGIFNPNNKLQSREVKDVQWFCYDNAQRMIRDHNIERKELLKRVHMLIMKNSNPNPHSYSYSNSHSHYKHFSNQYNYVNAALPPPATTIART